MSPEFEATRPDIDEEGAVEAMKARREEAHDAWCDLDTPHTVETCPEIGYDEHGVYFKPRPAWADRAVVCHNTIEAHEEDESF